MFIEHLLALHGSAIKKKTGYLDFFKIITQKVKYIYIWSGTARMNIPIEIFHKKCVFQDIQIPQFFWLK